MNWERWARASGAVFVVLAAAAFIIAGESPKVSDSPEKIAAFAAVQFVVLALFATLAFSVAGAGDTTLTKALYDLDVGLDNLDGLAAGLFVLAAAVGLKRTASIPAWLAWAGLVVAALFFLRATTWASEGFWSPSGDYILIAILCGLAWILVTSIVLFVREPSEQATEPTAAPAAL